METEYENHNYDISNYSGIYAFTTERHALAQRTGKCSQNVCFGLMVKFHTTTKVILSGMVYYILQRETRRGTKTTLFVLT